MFLQIYSYLKQYIFITEQKIRNLTSVDGRYPTGALTLRVYILPNILINPMKSEKNGRDGPVLCLYWQIWQAVNFWKLE